MSSFQDFENITNIWQLTIANTFGFCILLYLVQDNSSETFIRIVFVDKVVLC